MTDPELALSRLSESTAPWIVGVRHHSPALAACMPALLDRFAPTDLLIELPADLGQWLGWLGDPKARAPLALAATREGDAESLAFYPFADFSPELVAIRWALARGVRVEAFDLPVGERQSERARRGTSADHGEGSAMLDALCKQSGADDFEELWDRIIEARAEGQDPEALRRAALLLGWTLRLDAARSEGVLGHDLRRESFMRSRIAAARDREAARIACVVGAFHASALVDPPLLREIPPFTPSPNPRAVTTSLAPYSFELLDSRSGYPAGIRDPSWQQRVVEELSAGRPLEPLTARAVTEIARVVRGQRHVASFSDALEAARLALDLARIRGLVSPSRRELLEAIATTMAQGEPIGRGRVLARALSKVMVGNQRGALAPGTPRSGLAPHVERLFQELRLPGAGDEEKDLTLDPHRSALDRRREVTLERLSAADITYAERVATGRMAQGLDALGSRWQVGWTPATDATIEVAGLFGPTLAEAARGALLRRRARLAEQDRAPPTEIEILSRAARCGLADLVTAGLERLVTHVLPEATFVDLVAANDLVARMSAGHIAALPLDPSLAVPEAPVVRLAFDEVAKAVVEALVRSVEGLAGATDIASARALADLMERPERVGLGVGRFGAAVESIAAGGTPLMQGAASATSFLIGRSDGALFGGRIASYLDGTIGDPSGAHDRAERVKGLLTVAVPMLESEPAFLEAILERFAAWSDSGFLLRLPSLREGFEVLSTRARSRLLAVLAESADPASRAAQVEDLALDPERLAALAAADEEIIGRLVELWLEPTSEPLAIPPRSGGDEPLPRQANGRITLRDRLRLVLGHERAALPPNEARYAVALERLYGHGQGEGSREYGGAGLEPSQPSVRVWSEEIAALFGEDVRQEVVARAAERGDAAAALDLDPDSVRPSVELLQQILSLKGGLAEADLSKLRALVARIVAMLVEALATRVRPALSGLVSTRTTRRPGGPPDLAKTLSKNLKSARRQGDGFTVVPERVIFKERQRRSLDWHVVLVVDVSGSMEPSVISSALMSAILSGMPALTVHFLAFSDRVVDLSGHASDPLALLLEIAVGGGTSIAGALRYARSLITVPARTLCLVVSDFEEGGPVGDLLYEVRALVEAGVKPLGLAALDDRGAPRFAASIAEQVAGAGMPVAALSPTQVARWIAEQIR